VRDAGETTASCQAHRPASLPSAASTVLTGFLRVFLLACYAAGAPGSTPTNLPRGGGSSSSPRHERGGTSTGCTSQFRRSSRRHQHHALPQDTPSSPPSDQKFEKAVSSDVGSGLWYATGRDVRRTSAAAALPSAAAPGEAEPVFWSLPSSPASEEHKQKQQRDNQHDDHDGRPPLVSSTSADAAYFRSDDLRSSTTGNPGKGSGVNSNTGGQRGIGSFLRGNIVGAARGFEDRSGLFGERHR